TDANFTNPAPVSASTIGLAPNAENSKSILIWDGDEVTVTADVSVDELTIENSAGSKLIVDDNVTVTLENGAGNDLTMGVDSRLEVNGAIINLGTIAGSTAAATTFESGSKYEHRQNAGVIPLATWHA